MSKTKQNKTKITKNHKNHKLYYTAKTNWKGLKGITLGALKRVNPTNLKTKVITLDIYYNQSYLDISWIGL